MTLPSSNKTPQAAVDLMAALKDSLNRAKKAREALDERFAKVDTEEMVCGESYDHDLMLIDEADGYATYECRVCGAEVASEPDDQEA